MKPMECLLSLDIAYCIECKCPVIDDWKFVDLSNKNLIECPQCGELYNITELEETQC